MPALPPLFIGLYMTTLLPFITFFIVAPRTLLIFESNTFSTFATGHIAHDFLSSGIITTSPSFILRSWSFTLQLSKFG